MKSPILIKGGFATDDRGYVNFNNSFILKQIKRFYIVQNHKTGFIRAWHGHRKEKKFVLCVSGAAMIAAVKISDFKSPKKDQKINKFFLSERDGSMVYIPNGYANGFKTLNNKTKLIFFSSATVRESLKDDFRYNYDYWNPWKDLYR